MRLDLYLGDARELIFDRVFDRDDVPFDGIEVEEPGIERRRLSASGRARHKNDAVGQRQESAEARAQILAHAQPGEIEIDCGTVQNSQYNAFAMQRWNCRNTDID